jgi:hypothetical protein
MGNDGKMSRFNTSEGVPLFEIMQINVNATNRKWPIQECLQGKA